MSSAALVRGIGYGRRRQWKASGEAKGVSATKVYESIAIYHERLQCRMLRSRHCELHELVTVTVTDSVINLGFLAPRGVRLRTTTSYSSYLRGGFCSALNIMGMRTKRVRFRTHTLFRLGVVFLQARPSRVVQ